MKRNLVLLALALCFGFAISAAPALATTLVVAGGNQIVRPEGHTESISSVSIQDTTGAQVIPDLTTINIDYSATVTNTPDLANSCSLTVAGAAAACPGTWTVTPSGNRVTVLITPAFTFANAGDSIIIGKVRVDVAALGSGVGFVTATLSSTPSSANVTYNPTTVNVALVVSHSTTITIGSTPLGILTCNPPSAAGNANYSFEVKVKEATQHAFTTKAEEQANTDPVVPLVNIGTQIWITFTGVPKNLQISLDALDVDNAGVTFVEALPIAKKSTGPTTPIVFKLTVATDTANLDTAAFDFSVFLASTDTLALGSATITGSAELGPVGDISDPARTTVPVLFADVPTSGTVFGVSDCVTDLLFPWVVADAPGGTFDTGMALANTSNDDSLFTNGGATPQSGSCALTGFKSDASGTVTATVGPIAAGGTGTIVLSTQSAWAGFRGYVIAICGFQNGHGFAFITQDNATANGTSQGYLGLVIPNPGLVSRSPAGGNGAGESLGN